jgi:hypothetical protein
MILTYLGKQFVKIQQGDTVVAVNPISKDSKYSGKISRFGSDLALITVNHPDTNGVDTVTYNEQAPFVISGPGEYEARDITVDGIGFETFIDKEKYMATAYSATIEGIVVGVLPVLPESFKASDLSMASPNILIIPLSGDTDIAKAYKVAVSLEPNIIIPVDYDEKTLKAFLKEAGQTGEEIEKLTIKKRDIESKEAEVVVLSY